MKLKFKHQAFQEEAARAVCDVFAGQPYHTMPAYDIDRGDGTGNSLFTSYVGYGNHPILLREDVILQNIQKIQQEAGLQPSETLAGKYDLTIEMETGTGKTYTYIKTMYELRKRYGWSKFIIVVPSIAIREGVYKTFQITADHFLEEYSERIQFFVYNSSRLTDIQQFAASSTMQVMIINAQAFNARGKDARRIYMELDEFQSRVPMEVIAQTHPILIIDEPQSVEGKQTKERLKEFQPLFTLRYSATPREKYDLIYRLDALDAYNQRLVKRIAVKGIEPSKETATDGYVYLAGLNITKDAPTANLEFDCKGKSGVRKVLRKVDEGYDLYAHSKELEEYKNNYIVKTIDGRDNSITFVNGIKLHAGEVIGDGNEAELRRIQIRETILSHLEREKELYKRGIKVLSLFFIDEVAHYRTYDEEGHPQKGSFARMFEEEYKDILQNDQRKFGDDAYQRYLDAIPVEETHAGYFSIDKKGKMVDSKAKRGQEGSDDQDAYDLIMKDKERLLDLDPKRSPVRFIFSHSALKEGWDNPNVFQICTLKQSSSEVRKRQEVGRGLRLCVNQQGDRMDEATLGAEVQDVNVLTVIASESYDAFARGLQSEISEAIQDRPWEVTASLFEGKLLSAVENGKEKTLPVTEGIANTLYKQLIRKGYLDDNDHLTPAYHEAKREGKLQFPDVVKGFEGAVIRLLDSVYDPKAIRMENALDRPVTLHVEEKKLATKAFQSLWEKINEKSVYTVDFDEKELIQRAIASLDRDLHIQPLYYLTDEGIQKESLTGKDVRSGEVFIKERQKDPYKARQVIHAGRGVKYDLVGKLVADTGLTRRAVIAILQGIRKDVFDQFKSNPEEFLIKAASLINDQKASTVIEHIAYHALEDRYDTDVFTEYTIRGKVGENALAVKKHLYDYLRYDSDGEKKFAEALDAADAVALYIKLPNGFYISTPMGHYNPDWAIAFKEGDVKHIYFVAETKGSSLEQDLRPVEQAKIDCARKHFAAISHDKVTYDVVDSYKALLEKVMK